MALNEDEFIKRLEQIVRNNQSSHHIRQNIRNVNKREAMSRLSINFLFTFDYPLTVQTQKIRHQPHQSYLITMQSIKILIFPCHCHGCHRHHYY